MSGEPQLFRINPQSQESDRVEQVDFARLGLRERRDIQEWVAANPGILGEDLLIIGKEFSGFDRTDERLDLLAVDSDGKLVVIELKRDDSGADAHWQAIKYASYLRRATIDQIVSMLAEYRKISQEGAEQELIEHLSADGLSGLNNDQRIILASHRFAPEVTSAALWLNDKASGEDLITCITLTPYQDASTGSLYIQATTIIPVPGEEEYLIGVGSNAQTASGTKGNNFAANMRRTKERNKNDEVTAFVRNVSQLILKELSDEVRPDKKGRHAGGWPHFRYYNLWYSRDPWRNHGVCYAITLHPQDESDSWHVYVHFTDERNPGLPYLEGIQIHDNQTTQLSRISVGMEIDTLNDSSANVVAGVLRHFIEKITPLVDTIEDGNNEEEA